jgi:transcription-repair coupling factor (superfamily II helicase)
VRSIARIGAWLQRLLPEVRPTQVTLPFATHLPEEYVPEMTQRLSFYKRVAAARDAAGLEETVQELRERYGPLPKPARRLIWAAELRLVGQAIGLERLDWRPDSLELTFRQGGAFDPGRVAALLTEGGGRVRMSGERRLARRWEATADEPRFEEAREVVQGLVA